MLISRTFHSTSAQERHTTMFKKLKSLLMLPFTAGYKAIDTRPSGGAYRSVSSKLFATPGSKPGVIALVVGHGKVEQMPLVVELAAPTPEDAANAVLGYVNKLTRTQARAINSTDRSIVRELNRVAKARREAEVAAGKARQAGSTGNLSHQPDGGQASGETVLVLGTAQA